MGVRAGMVGVVGCRDGEACSMHGNHQQLGRREGGQEGRMGHHYSAMHARLIT